MEAATLELEARAPNLSKPSGSCPSYPEIPDSYPLESREEPWSPPSWTPVPCPPRRGRPTAYDQETAMRIFVAIAGGSSVRRVCAQEWAPHHKTFYRWLAEVPDFAQKYDLATTLRTWEMIDEMIAIADDASRDWIVVESMDKQGNRTRKIVFDRDAVERARLRIDARKWHIERMRPRKFGRQARSPQPFPTCRIQRAQKGPLTP